MTPRLLAAALLASLALLAAACGGGDDSSAQIDRTFYVKSSITAATAAEGTFESAGDQRDQGQAAIDFDPFGDPPAFLRGTARLTGANGTITMRFDGRIVTTSAPSLTGAASSVSIGTFTVTEATGGYATAVGREGRFAAAVDGEARTVRASFGPQPEDAGEERAPSDGGDGSGETSSG